MPKAHGRAYLHGLDRRTFDAALWDHLERHPTVERREGFHVTDVVRDERGRVTGVRGHRPGQAEETLRGRCVVSADGRFSVVARKVGAKTTEERTLRGTTVYYAYWRGPTTYGGEEDWGHVHTGIDGFSAFITPAAPGEWGVLVQCRKDYSRADEGVERWYESTLSGCPAVWRRFARATRITELSGMRDVGNLYREAGGDGWALVGDAYHQKDSYDGQGIYDALAGAKILAEELVSWHAGEASWEEALGRYRAEVRAESHPMFRRTMERLDREIYGEPPLLVTKTLLRWMLTDPEYTGRLGALVTRSVHPDEWMNGATVLRTLSRGLAGDLRRIVQRRADPSAMPVFDLSSGSRP